VEHVSEFAFAEQAPLLAYTVAAPKGEGNGLHVRDLGEGGSVFSLHEATSGRYTQLTWAREARRLAFTAAVLDDEGEPGDAEVWVWTGSGDAKRMVSRKDALDGFTVPSKNELIWSRDGARLFFGFKPIGADDEGHSEPKTDDEEATFDPYDLEAVLARTEVDVWHWNDPRIIPNQKERWKEHERDRVFLAVVHLDSGKIVPLADTEVPEIVPADNARVALGAADGPYLKQMTWDGVYGDIYVVDLSTGERTLVVERLARGWRSRASLSPDGASVLYYRDGNWHLYDVVNSATRNLTAGLDVPFADEDHDYPSDAPGYGHSEWLDDSSAVMIYDKYDIWQVFADRHPAVNITGGEGRRTTTQFRVVDLDSDDDTIPADRALLLEAYHDLEKHDAFYSGSLGTSSLSRLFGDGQHRLGFVSKAEDADRLVFTSERYEVFPDLWVTNMKFAGARKLSDANPQINDYAWGSSELVEWTSIDGVPLQGVLIKPGNYQPGTRYPVLVYYYRFSSQRLNLFNEPVVNHRPSFPVYASNGYAVFLPDIRFEVGRPGFSATKCLVPGVQKLVDMGVADPDAIGLHGHSWSGYQTAFVITQTDIFAAAAAGAPVSNMTSAYSGIRWGTGLARQFQYEQSQSRIGGSLWEFPERYIENSPVFFADRINTPLLIEFGDEDEAVPWYQGIELYLACRRLEKNCIMLQYRGEPHHLKKYANKLDYSIRMKQFFDHWLKGDMAPAWMTEGVPYRGE
jgi:dipeptidyl aminopeptidase/acylaminoacyl peptidase